MPRIESTLFVQKSLEDTFNFLNVPESHLNFIPRCVEFKQTSNGKFGKVGTTIKGSLRYFGLLLPVDYKIIEHNPDNSLAMKGELGPISFKDGYILNASHDKTEIKFWLELDLTGWTRIFFPFAGLIGKIHAWETLRNLEREIMGAVVE